MKIKKKKSPRSRFTGRQQQAKGYAANVESNYPTSLSGDSPESLGEIDSEFQFVSRVHRCFKEASEQSWERRESHIENLKFDSGDQYSDKDKARLRRQKRPAIVINLASRNMRIVQGLYSKAKHDIDLVPDNPEDSLSAELMEHLLKWVMERGFVREKFSRTFYKKALSGLGFLRLSYDYKQRPQGHIKVEELDLLRVFWDPNYPDCSWDDTEWVIVADWYTLDDAINTWPEFETRIRQKFGEWLNPDGQRGEVVGDSQADFRYFWDPATQRIRMMEMWYRVLKEQDVAIFSDGDFEDDEEEVDKLKAVAEEVEGTEEYMVIDKRKVRKCRVAHVFGDMLFDDSESPMPFNDLPVEPWLGYHFWRNPVGLMDYMKDPQRAHNKHYMAITEIAGRTAMSGWMNKSGQGAQREDMENYSQGAGVVIEYESVEPTPIRPPQLPEILVELMTKAGNSVQEVVNINDEMLGQTTQTTVSGKAIEARQSGSVTSQEELFGTTEAQEARVVRLIIRMIQDLMTKEEATRILGSMLKQNGNGNGNGAPPPNGASPPEGSEVLQDPMELERLLSRAFNIDYHVTITTKPYAATQGMARAQALMDLDKSHPGQVPFQLIVEALSDAGMIDKANATKLVAQLQQAQPPQPVQQQLQIRGNLPQG